jgi:hypothetical protein
MPANTAYEDATPSNKPLEWTGRQQLSATPPKTPCLPLRGSVIRTLKCDQTAGINPNGHARQVHADKSGLTAYHVEILMPCCCSELRVDRSK